jgi:predicted Rossmann-fold nucleotide-binding protein
MKAGQDGAGRDQSFGVNIRLPFEQTANEIIQNDAKLITFRYFFTRKLVFLKETDAIALFPGGFGTMDEAFETLTLLQTGKSPLLPLVCVDRRRVTTGTPGTPMCGDAARARPDLGGGPSPCTVS